MLCVQWHPERMKSKEASPFSENLKKQFLSAVRKIKMKKLSVIDPATEDVIAELNEDTKQSLQNKFELLKAAQHDWQQKSLSERIAIIEKFSNLLEANKEELALYLHQKSASPYSSHAMK
jgi:acyl-CoA reductase-like NAD-dependent aldehyde dehydrogenase